MNNVTTFETSQRLKAAGFPQPVPAFGHLWYIFDKQFNKAKFEPAIVVGVHNAIQDKEFSVIYKSGSCREYDFDDLSNFYFAPTAADILKELPTKTLLFLSDTWHCGIQHGEILRNEFGWQHIAMSDNSAEAAALAYLSLNEKHNEK